MVKLTNLFLSFLKIGLIGFGGGSALIPVIEKELVQSKKWLTNEEYIKYTVIGNITPGALPVKLGAMAGYQISGISGSLTAAYAVTLPGVLATVLIISLFSLAGENAVHIIERLSVGITVFILYLLTHFIVHTLRAGGSVSGVLTNVAICAASFAICGSRPLLRLIAAITGNESIAQITPVLSVSSIHLILSALFLIFFASLAHKPLYILPALPVAAAYLLSVGRRQLIPASWTLPLLGVMILMLLFAALLKKKTTRSRRKDKPLSAASNRGADSDMRNASLQTRKTDEFRATPVKIAIPKKLIAAITAYVAVSAIFAAACLPLSLTAGSGGTHEVPEFFINVSASTLTSFGGGEAYVSVADGFFVSEGFVTPQIFYQQIVPVANALPGPILVKIASAIGFTFADGYGGAALGWLVALGTASIAVGLCGIISLVLFTGYEAIKGSVLIRNLNRYILPVICGMLIATSISMSVEALTITSAAGFSAPPAFLALLIGIAAIYLLKNRYKKIPDILILVAAALIGGLIL